MTLPETVSKMLVRRLEESGITRKILAGRLHTSKAHVTQVLSGRNITLDTLEELAASIGMSVTVEIGTSETQQRLGQFAFRFRRWRDLADQHPEESVDMLLEMIEAADALCALVPPERK